MADSFQIEIATPESLVFQKTAEWAEIPGKDRYFGVLAGHAALLSELGEGSLTITSAGKTERFTVTGGYVEVRDNHVRVLADSIK